MLPSWRADCGQVAMILDDEYGDATYGDTPEEDCEYEQPLLKEQ